ncbi:efflux transporter outer membrane subunit [Chitinophaga sp.]|uniref:efflux transporter outer membrane subunit n=1 Tax=Chitinophaga sp. TaxID=1869181 RepID=UPI0031D6C385
MNKYLYVTGFAMMVMACRVGKDYSRPAVNLPSAYNGATTDTNNIAAVPLAAFIKDDALQQLVDSALHRNFDLRVAVQHIATAAASLKTARQGNLPDVNLPVTANRTWYSKNSLNGSLANQFASNSYIDDYNAGLSLNWEVISWGKISRLKEAALADYLQTAEASRAVQTSVISEVAQGYYNLLMLDTQKEVALKNIQLADSTLTMMQLQYNSGLVTNLALEQTAAQLRTAQALVPQIEQQIRIQENALKLLTGEMPGNISRGNLRALQADTIPAAGVPVQLLQYRPDVHAAELAVQAANARAGVAAAALYPALTITASLGANSFTPDKWFNLPGSLYKTLGAGITQPVFQRGKLKADLEIARIAVETSTIGFQRSVVTAVQEVSNALATIEKLKAQYAFVNQRVAHLQRATNNANLLFQNGMANYLEVITAQSNALQSELELATIKRDQLNAVIALYRALGGGWK